MRIHEQIKMMMDKKGITSYQISRDLEVDEGQLSRFFNGKANLSLNKIYLILEYLECEIKIIEKTC